MIGPNIIIFSLTYLSIRSLFTPLSMWNLSAAFSVCKKVYNYPTVWPLIFIIFRRWFFLKTSKHCIFWPANFDFEGHCIIPWQLISHTNRLTQSFAKTLTNRQHTVVLYKISVELQLLFEKLNNVMQPTCRWCSNNYMFKKSSKINTKAPGQSIIFLYLHLNLLHNWLCLAPVVNWLTLYCIRKF